MERETAAGSIGVGALLKILEGTGPPAVRACAARALGGIGPGAKDALPALRRAAQSEDWRLSAAAEQAISRIGGE